jgi:hypothetical protein
MSDGVSRDSPRARTSAGFCPKASASMLRSATSASQGSSSEPPTSDAAASSVVTSGRPRMPAPAACMASRPPRALRASARTADCSAFTARKAWRDSVQIMFSRTA